MHKLCIRCVNNDSPSLAKAPAQLNLLAYSNTIICLIKTSHFKKFFAPKGHVASRRPGRDARPVQIKPVAAVGCNFTQFRRGQVTTRKLLLTRQQSTASHSPYFGLVEASQMFIYKMRRRLDIVIKEQNDLSACKSDPMIAGTS